MRILKLVFTLCLVAHPASAQGPVAIVEEVESKTAAIEAMDYLPVGKAIVLEASDRIVIAYFKSCWRETIVGGAVIVGTEQSTVTGGRVERVKVRCIATDKGAASKETGGSGAMVFRKKPDSKQIRATIFGLSPIIEVGEATSLMIQRLDQPDKSIQLNLAKHSAARSGLIDLAKADIVLVAGAIYKATAGQREVIFKVDAAAEPRSKGLVDRLVAMPSR